MTKRIIVTGASNGIGEAIARKLADNDYQVILVARNKEKLETITHEINKKSSKTAYFYQVDVSKEDQVERMINDVKENRSEEHTSELQSRGHLVCRLLLEKK